MKARVQTNYDAPIPEDALAFLRSKGYTASYYWDDTWKEVHAQAFTVAKMLKLDLLKDVHNALLQSLANGETFETFKKNITPQLQKAGWWGRQEMTNPYTSDKEDIQLGSARRLKTIYQTNMSTAYQAGHYKAMKEVADMLPYWQYIAVMDGRTRTGHEALNGKVFRADDPIWDTIYPPNGWHCRCTVRALSAAMVERMGVEVESGDDRIVTQDVTLKNGEVVKQSLYIDPKTGAKVTIGKGWDYNVGKAWLEPFTLKPSERGYKTVGLEGGYESIAQIKGSKINAARLLPDNETDEFYVDAFLKEFGGSVGAPVIYRDIVGDAVLLNESLFTKFKGQAPTAENIKVNKGDRGQFMLVLADAIKEPDELWLTPEVKNGKTVYNKQYIRFFDDKDHAAGYALFQLNSNGEWEGRTVFPYKESEKHKVDNTRLFNNGSLIYKK
jgi:SPP1 gp7 family putative phage head morphogenesis protein